MGDAATHARSRRGAIIVAASVEVQCPHCGEPQPNPDDESPTWRIGQVLAELGPKVCVACDEPFVLHPQSRATIQREEEAH